MKACLIVLMSAITVFPWVESVMATETNLHGGGKILLVVPEDPSALEKYAIAELAKHVEQLTDSSRDRARGCHRHGQPDRHRAGTEQPGDPEAD